MNETALRRSTLISQIGEVFRARGYEGATLTHLAAATGLGKASLYHHFPGGKAEMADVLLREAIGALQHRAFSRLAGSEPPAERLQRFLDGYAAYLEGHDGVCLLAVLALGGARDDLGATIAGQLRDWQTHLTAVFEEAGHKPKRAARAAGELLNALYGAQVVARMTADPQHLKRSLKRLAKTLPT